ncbi:MAG: hypothetical protein JNL50_07535 [Phycisphaerae bacterium]|nr:hypothetical protein [Phycisphaerae bacterium]
MASTPAPSTPILSAPVASPPAPRSMPLDVAAVWAEVNRIAATSRRLRAVLGDLRLTSLDAAGAALDGSALAVSAARAVQGELAAAFQQACGRSVAISLRASAENSGDAAHAGPGGPAGAGNNGSQAASVDDMRKHPLVTAAEELFGARLVRIDPRQGGL